MQSAVLHPHLLIWRDPPVWPFVWRGMLPLAALALAVSFALGPVARNWIEGAVQRETRDRRTQRCASGSTREGSPQLSGDATHRRPYRSGRAVGVQSQPESGARRGRA